MKLLAFAAVVVLLIIYQLIQNKKKKVQEQPVETLVPKKKLPAVRVRIFQGHWDPKAVRVRPECLFVFGDNFNQQCPR